MIVKVALMVVVDSLFEGFTTLWTLWIGTLTWVDRFSFLAFDYQVFGTTFEGELLLETNTIFLESFAMVLRHVLR